MKKVFFPLSIASKLGLDTLFKSENEKLTETVMAYFEAVDAGDFDAIVANMLTEDFRAVAPIAPIPFDRVSWPGVGLGFKTAFPDMKHELLDCFENDNKVSARGEFKGTNTGPNMGNPPTGNKVTLAFNSIFEFDDEGKIKSLNIQFDMKTFEAQLMAGINLNAAAEALVNGIMAAADAANVEQLLSFFAPGAVHHFGGITNTNDELKMRVTGFKAAFPDIHRELEVLAFGNNVITCKGRLTGTNTGMFMGKPATGKKINITVLGVYKLNEQGKVTEAWVEMDSAALMQQLNA